MFDSQWNVPAMVFPSQRPSPWSGLAFAGGAVAAVLAGDLCAVRVEAGKRVVGVGQREELPEDVVPVALDDARRVRYTVVLVFGFARALDVHVIDERVEVALHVAGRAPQVQRATGQRQEVDPVRELDRRAAEPRGGGIARGPHDRGGRARDAGRR